MLARAVWLAFGVFFLCVSAGSAKRLLRRRRSGEPVVEPLLIDRHTWGSGFAADFADLPIMGAESGFLRWSPTAEEVFERHWREVQFPARCASQASSSGYVEAQVDMSWGVTSALRDVTNQLLYALLTDRFLVFSQGVSNGPDAERAMEQYRQCRGNRSWIEGCYFPNLTGCTDAHLLKQLPASSREVLIRRVPKVENDQHWFLKHSQPLWDELLRTNAVWITFANGTRFQHVDPKLEYAERLAMFRVLMIRVAFRPGPALQHAISEVEQRTRLPELAFQGPLVVAHVRRTDKLVDFKSGVQELSNTNIYRMASGINASLAIMTNVLVPWLTRKVGSPRGLFLMSDDWRVLEQEGQIAMKRHLPNTSVVVDTESGRFAPRDEKLLQLGHETWGHRAEQGYQVLAEVFVAAKEASYVVGCGTSGVTQLMLQLIGAKFRMDPNVLGIWEDDVLEVKAIQKLLRRGD